MPMPGVGRVAGFARTTFQNARSYGKSAIGYAGRGMVKAKDLPEPLLNSLGHGGAPLRSSDRVLMSRTSRGARRAQPLVMNRPGAQSSGRFVSKDMYNQAIRNRNVRYAGYGAMAGSAGMANAVTSNNGRSYAGPASRIRTTKGVGRNA
jgi:hypothetical protein